MINKSSACLQALFTAACLALPATAATVTWVSDDFSDNNRTSGGTNGLAWYVQGATLPTTIDASAGALTLSGLSGNRLLYTHFSPVALTAENITSITLSFDMKVSNVFDSGSPPQWRFGLASADGYQNADLVDGSSGSTAYANAKGASVMSFITATSFGNSTVRRTSDALGTGLGSTGASNLNFAGSSFSTPGFTKNVSRSVSLTLTRQGTSLAYAFSIDGSPLFSATDSAPATFNFSDFWMLNTASNLNSLTTIDNFLITVNQVSAVPEPSSFAAIGALAALGFVGCSRRRSARVAA